jgi:hypothetical protein
VIATEAEGHEARTRELIAALEGHEGCRLLARAWWEPPEEEQHVGTGWKIPHSSMLRNQASALANRAVNLEKLASEATLSLPAAEKALARLDDSESEATDAPAEAAAAR